MSRKLEPRKSISISALPFFTLILIGTMGWILVALHVSESRDTIVKALAEIVREVLTVGFIAVAAAIAIERLLTEEKPADDRELMLRKVGIVKIFPRRQDAGDEFLRSVRDENVRSIAICGISLRDFLPAGGTLHEVWRVICERMKREQDADLPIDKRLHVRLLMLLPNSDEGNFRHRVEGTNENDPGGMPFDIPHGLSIVRSAQQEIFRNTDTRFLQVRLYEHCPFAFVFSTENDVHVEQYDYRDQKMQASMPLIMYEHGSLQYKEQMFSIETIWDHARAEAFRHEVGTAKAIREARVNNIFRHEDRQPLTRKQMEAIRGAAGASIDILAITGRFYVSNANIVPELQRVSRLETSPSGEVRPAVPVRFAIVNPVSQQAILRAVADDSPPEKVGEKLRDWDWIRHRETALYRDARRTAQTLYTWKDQLGCDVELKLYSSSVACMILQTDRQAFVEQYMYGRSKSFQPGFPLGGEYPVIEYDTWGMGGSKMAEHQVVAATFEMIWKSYSVSWNEYANRNEETEFELNLQRLRDELGIAREQAHGG